MQKFLLPYQEKKQAKMFSTDWLKSVLPFMGSTAKTSKKKSISIPQITFLGAAKTVTGSKYLLEFKDKKILVDSGLFQGVKDDKLKNRIQLPINPKNIDAVLLTHAHLDHSGYIPLLVKNGFKGKVYTTQATYELCKLILPDSGFLQEEDAKYAKKKKYSKHEDPEPLYTQEDALNSLKNFKIVRFNDKVELDEDINFTISPVGHILGAGCIKVNLGSKSILFSGDLGRYNDEILYDPKGVEGADYIVTESTYGDRVHKETDVKEKLCEIINKTVGRGGNIIIPAFAIGRSQSLLYYFYQLRKENKIPSIPVFLDSPMSIKATNLLDDFADLHKLSAEECFKIYDNTKFTTTVEQSKRIFESKVPAIIVSASGMLGGGRILHHVAHYAPDNKNSILLVGFQAFGTKGRDLVEGKKQIKIHGEVVKVNAEVIKLNNMSAHGDSNEMLNWLSQCKIKPKKVFVTHGEEKSSNAFAEKLNTELGWNTIVPEYFQIEQLN